MASPVDDDDDDTETNVGVVVFWPAVDVLQRGKNLIGRSAVLLVEFLRGYASTIEKKSIILLADNNKLA